jgi:hypothetical protein
MFEEQRSALEEKLAALQLEHRDLDQAIEQLGQGVYIDELQLRRLKKRKLLLRDTIARIESMLIPDEPA